jgi:hypothetical protein
MKLSSPIYFKYFLFTLIRLHISNILFYIYLFNIYYILTYFNIYCYLLYFYDIYPLNIYIFAFLGISSIFSK